MKKYSYLNKYKINIANKEGIFIRGNIFLLVYLSIKYPEINKVTTEKTA